MIGPEVLLGLGAVVTPGTFPLELYTKLLEDGTSDELTAPFVYVSLAGAWIEVPKGFVTDWASVPWICRVLFPVRGRYSKAAVVHDYLCSLARDRRGEQLADQIFLEIMEVLGVNWLQRRLMYRAVSLWDSYKGNR